MSQFGIQMYTLRETMKTPEDYETTLRRVAEMGYTNVQLTPPAFSGAEDTQRLLEKYGLAADSAICGVYQIPERLDQIEKDAAVQRGSVKLNGGEKHRRLCRHRQFRPSGGGGGQKIR